MANISSVVCWTEEVSDEETVKISIDLALPHARRAGRFAPMLLEHIGDRNLLALANMELDYAYDDNVISVMHARQALAFFQKLESLPLGVDKEAVAFDKFIQSENLCKETNHIFDLHERGLFCFRPRVESVLFLAQRKIAKVLGCVPDWSEFEFSFGPGANTSVKAQVAGARAKLHAPLACSDELLGVASAILEEAPAWVSVHACSETETSWTTDVEVHTGRLQFVPKSAKTYRSIVVEPSLNSFAQKGVGTYMKACLKRAGLDLHSQERNQHLALIGSLAGNLATVDLSSASDTVSKAVVGHLLPFEWWDLLSCLRTGTVTYRDKEYALEKFSSMGNAYTFELESLIFWALALSVCGVLGLPKAWTQSYGDDIIVPAEACELLFEVLHACGFVVNVQKTFVSGPFRESCGKDYFLGSDIRPFYLKSNWSPMRLFILHNFYMRDFNFLGAARVRKMIHPSLRLFGPDGYGDGHLLGDWTPYLRSKHRARGWEGGTFDTFSRKRKSWRKPLSRGDYVLPAYSVYVRSGADAPTDPYAVRGSTGYKRISIYTNRQGIFF